MAIIDRIGLDKAFRKAMIDQEITQSQLAERMDISPAYVSAILNGHKNITIEFIINAGKALRIDESRLYAFFVIPFVNERFNELIKEPNEREKNLYEKKEREMKVENYED